MTWPSMATHGITCFMIGIAYSQGSRNSSIPSAPEIRSEASSQATLLRTPYFVPSYPTSSISVNLTPQCRSPIPELVANLQGCRFSRSQCTYPIPSQVAICVFQVLPSHGGFCAYLQNSMHHFLLRGVWRGVVSSGVLILRVLVLLVLALMQMDAR
ncbi:hypothetical protein GGI35DRAFT_189140 [Trichoderma velutinum]